MTYSLENTVCKRCGNEVRTVNTVGYIHVASASKWCDTVKDDGSIVTFNQADPRMGQCDEVVTRFEYIESMVAFIGEAVEGGFDTRCDDGYELFAGEGMFGDPADLTEYELMHAFESIRSLYRDAWDNLSD